jgi:hypothetical protein
MNEEKHPAIHYATWRLRAFHLGAASLLTLMAVMATGCGGISASKSVSPLDFFMPGLMQNRPASPQIPTETNSVPLLAQANLGPR